MSYQQDFDANEIDFILSLLRSNISPEERENIRGWLTAHKEFCERERKKSANKQYERKL